MANLTNSYPNDLNKNALAYPDTPMDEHMVYILIIHLSAIVADILVLSALHQRREPTSIIAWLLVIILLPYIAVPLYFVFRSRKRKKKAKVPIKLACSEEIISESDAWMKRLLEKCHGQMKPASKWRKMDENLMSIFAPLL